MKMCHLFLTITILTTLCQHVQTQNLIPNGSFELNRQDLPHGQQWRTGSYQQFNEMSTAWFSPLNSSPDYLEAAGAYHWKEYNVKLSGYKPIDGTKWIGITTYGCSKKYGHCREYVQIKLDKPLKTGQTYYASFWASRLKNSAIIKTLGILFSDTLDGRISLEFTDLQPQIEATTFIGEKAFKWEQVSGLFTAAGPHQFLTIGNLSLDEDTEIMPAKGDSKKYAYYFIDHIELAPASEYYASNKLIIDNIHYKTDQHRLPQANQKALTTLITYLKQTPDKKIVITGHTDNTGDRAYNIDLSLKRAEGVRDYLIQQGIASDRIDTFGKGDEVPIDVKQTEAARRKNRRIEIEVE